MRVLAFILTVLTLAACAGAPSTLPTGQIRADFPAGGIANQIEIQAVDRLALRSAALVAPDGHATPAVSITTNPAPTETVSPQLWSGPNTGAVLSGGIGGSNALSPGLVGASPQVQSRLLAVVSTASITVPDPVIYRRDWQKYRIRLDFGTPPGEVETQEVAAPAPPPVS